MLYQKKSGKKKRISEEKLSMNILGNIHNQFPILKIILIELLDNLKIQKNEHIMSMLALTVINNWKKRGYVRTKYEMGKYETI